MDVQASFLEQLQKIDKGLSVVWNSMLERFQILWLDPVTKSQRIVITVEEDNGDFRPCDARALIYCSRTVDWEALHKYPKPGEWFMGYMARKDAQREKLRAARKEERLYWNKHHRKEWKSALENARSGRMGVVAPEEKKIQIQVPGWAKREGLLIEKGGART